MIPKVKRICGVCCKKFEIHPYLITQGRGKFCSPKCYWKNLKGNKRPQSKKGKNKTCPICKKVFYVQNCFIKNGKKICCSKECGYIYRTPNNPTGTNHPNWKGGRIKTQKGYIDFYIPSHPFANPKGYVREHRLVVEKQIGRYLKPEECVHHIGKRNDNRPHKLIGFSSNSAHIRFEHNPANVKPEEIIFDGRKL